MLPLNASGNFVLFQYFNLPDLYYAASLRNYSRVRDFYNQPPYLAAGIVAWSSVAASIDATLLEGRDYTSLKVTFRTYPTFQ